MSYCPKCGNKLVTDSRFCGQCGAQSNVSSEGGAEARRAGVDLSFSANTSGYSIAIAGAVVIFLKKQINITMYGNWDYPTMSTIQGFGILLLTVGAVLVAKNATKK